MNKRFKRIVSSISTICLLTASIISFLPGNVYADAQNIEVKPYPNIVDQRASYRVSMNINETMKAGIDTFTVIFPKESNIDSTVSSANITVNPTGMTGAGYYWDSEFRCITILEPLFPGDRIEASYRYQSTNLMSQLPLNIKYYDNTFGAGDPRSGNGKLDPGEQTYEDIDGNNKISIGDKRLHIMKFGATHHAQNSTVELGHFDYAVDGSNNPVNPLTNYHFSNLTFYDKDNNGYYSQEDWLVDDNGDGVLSQNDKIITGMFYYVKGSLVRNIDYDMYPIFDPCILITPFPATLTHIDNVVANNIYDQGEYIYRDNDLDNVVSNGDTRYSWVYTNGIVYFPTSIVVDAGGITDNDVGSNLILFQTAATNTELSRGADAIFSKRFYAANRPSPTVVMSGDRRLNDILISSYIPDAYGGAIGAPDLDQINYPYINFNANEKYAGFAPLVYNTNDPIYRDVTAPINAVSAGDIRLTNFSIVVDGQKIVYTAGSTVREGEKDIGLNLWSCVTAGIQHQEIFANGTFDPIEAILDPGVARHTFNGNVSANILVGPNYPDAGLPLTKGWAEVSDEVLVNSWECDPNNTEQKICFDKFPVIKPVVPIKNDSNYLLQGLNIHGGLLKERGRIYYTLTAVNNDVGESRTWEEKMVNLPLGSPMNAVKITWSPVQNASKYRIYRTFTAGSYENNSLIAEVSSPTTEYIDLGGAPLSGKPPTVSNSNFINVVLIRTDVYGNITRTTLISSDLADYTLNPNMTCACGSNTSYYHTPFNTPISWPKPATITFNQVLNELDTIVADYDIGVMVEKERLYIDPILGRAKLKHGNVINPGIFQSKCYEVVLLKYYIGRPDPTPLVRGVDYKFLDENLSEIGGYEKGMILFSIQIDDNVDYVEAYYIYKEQIRGDMLKVATGGEKTLETNEKWVIPGTFKLFKGRTLTSAPMINVLKSDRGYVVTFTTPVTIVPNNDYKINVTPDSPRDVNITFSRQTGITNPKLVQKYQLYARTSKEQTEALSNTYDILPHEPSIKLIPLTKQTSVNAGEQIALTVGVQDDYGNDISGATVVFNIISSPGGLATLDKKVFTTGTNGIAVAILTTSPTAGNNIVNVGLVGGSPINFNIQGTSGGAPGIVDRIVISPTSASVSVNKTVQFTAKAYNAANSEIPNIIFTWSVNPATLGSITGAGLFTAKAMGTGEIMVSAEGKMVFAQITVLAGVSRVAINPDIANLKINETKQFTAMAYDNSNVPINNPKFIWSVKPSDMGIITDSGIFTALKKGTAQIVASLDGIEGYATVMIDDTMKDTEGPVITILAPMNNESVTSSSIMVKGTVFDVSGVQIVRINGIVATYDPGSGVFSGQVSLIPGNNQIIVNAIDSIGNGSNKSINVVLSSPIIIKLVIGVKTAIIIKDGQSNFITIDIAPFTTSSRTMVPLRFIAEAFGADVQWVEDVPRTGEGRIIITLNKKNGTVIVLDMHTNSRYIRKTTTLAGGSPVQEVVDYPQTEPAPYIVKSVGRTVVPLRFISEAFGSKVDWDAATQGITITFTP